MMKDILKLSRPRFWLYTAGPYLVGSAVSSSFLLTIEFWIHFLYFLIPANIFLYGVNDIFDQDTDAFNAKKNSKEYRHHQKNHKKLCGVIAIIGSLSMLLLVTQVLPQGVLLLSAFLLLSFFYSAPPLRFKAHPFIDSLSNVLYVLPGFLGYFHATGTLPSLPIIVGAWAWSSAMHLFSAIPDIVCDAKAKLRTTAVVLGHKKSLVACSILWLSTLYASFHTSIILLIFLSFVYGTIPLLLVHAKEDTVGQVYWYFPYLNAVSGALLFFLIFGARII